jgi:hypothetical protein
MSMPLSMWPPGQYDLLPGIARRVVAERVTATARASNRFTFFVNPITAMKNPGQQALPLTTYCRPWGLNRVSGRFRRHIVADRFGIGLEHRTARRAELCLILPQAGHDPTDIGNLATAQSEDVRGAGHPLSERAAIVFRDRGARQYRYAGGKNP